MMCRGRRSLPCLKDDLQVKHRKGTEADGPWGASAAYQTRTEIGHLGVHQPHTRPIHASISPSIHPVSQQAGLPAITGQTHTQCAASTPCLEISVRSFGPPPHHPTAPAAKHSQMQPMCSQQGVTAYNETPSSIGRRIARPTSTSPHCSSGSPTRCRQVFRGAGLSWPCRCEAAR